ncbi:Type II/IV secretion system protein [uncultured archaeon]|nr:Type II/IV secretion system protein [uncultured archaeon]
MACRPSYQGNRLVMDCLTCGLGLSSAACLNSHLKTIATLDKPWKTMRYEEEMLVELDEERAAVFWEYVAIIRQVEQIMLNPQVYGHVQDDQYRARQKLLREFYEFMFQSPVEAVRILKDYNEPSPERAVFVEGWRTFRGWVNGILAAYQQSRLYTLSLQQTDLRELFLDLLGLKAMPYSQTFVKTVPAAAKLIEGGQYDLPYGVQVEIYEVPGAEAYLYVQKNAAIDNLPKELITLLQETINEELKAVKETVDYTTIFDSKMRTFRQHFIDQAQLKNLAITSEQALAMGREAAAWTVGLGTPLENLALDRDNLTDIYIDAPNAPIYIEHQKFGLCHTLWQYSADMLERAFRNVVATVGGGRKFDKDNPVIDVVLTRLAMRCHLQRPPATFGELQAALRLMKEQPFTYSEYLKYRSFTPFFAGYDDIMVGLGCSEAVLGLKGVGKTAFTSAKISAIGLKRRILPIQDIEEIPTRAYRKRGFHIGAVRVAASDREEQQQASGSELDLVSMTNASLRMGDACVIINEIRSRTAIQGVINMLNTQPGIFLLYNLHAQSLKDIQDRLELVFGMPAASMYSTDRYSFLKKVRFGRRSRVYRMLGFQYETDLDKRQYAEVFDLHRGDTIEQTVLECLFCDLPEANSQELYNSDLGSISKRLKLKFVPPALQRRADETGLPVKDYVMEAFYKGKLYDLVYHASVDYEEPSLIELDFVLKCLNASNRILKEHAGQEPDWGAYDRLMVQEFNQILEVELQQREQTASDTGQEKKTRKAPSYGLPKPTSAPSAQSPPPAAPPRGTPKSMPASPSTPGLPPASGSPSVSKPKLPRRPPASNASRPPASSSSSAPAAPPPNAPAPSSARPAQKPKPAPRQPDEVLDAPEETQEEPAES